MTSFPHPMRRQGGATLIEILVSILILMFGLLGLVGVMVQSQRAQLESFQRQQALLIAQDMVQRMQVNKAAISCYVLADYIGADHTTVPASSSCAMTGADRFSQDMGEWLAELQGANETTGACATDTTKCVGGIPAARGCISKDATTGIYQVSVAWQGSVELAPPPAGVTCGATHYGSENARRAVSLAVLF